MSQDENLLDFQQDRGDSDEIEILEVVGVDDEPIAVEPPRETRANGEPEESGDEDDEILLDIDGDQADEEPALEAAASAVVATEAPPPVADNDEDRREQLLRLQADYDNLRKRIDRERDDHRELANSALIGRLLPVLDNFERALAVVPSTEADSVMLDGMMMIYKQLFDELHREGLHAIEAMGSQFDPSIHDAVATDPDSDEPHNTVLEELQRGYVFRDRLLRPAMVKVSISSSGVPAEGTEDEES